MKDANKKPERIEVMSLFIPDELKAYVQWVCWKWEWKEKQSKWTKPPWNAKTDNHASSTDPSTWVSFDEAVTAYEENMDFDGIGFVPTGEDPYAMVDLDHCVDASNGNIEPWAQKIIDMFNSYTEITPSGTGLRIIIQGKLPGTGRKEGNIEVYDKGHYLTLTGHILPSSSGKIINAQNELESFLKECFLEKKPKIKSSVQDASENQSDDQVIIIQDSTGNLSDMEVIARAVKSKNGDRFSKLINGDISGYPSQSEAELALCSMLAFWCNRDSIQIDRIYRQSKLFRNKWDEKHGQQTYGHNTILKAIQDCKETYNIVPVDEHADSTGNDEVKIMLPSALTTISKSAEKIFTLMSASDMAFYRGGKVHEVTKDTDGRLKLDILSPDALRSRIEKLGSTYAFIKNQRGEYSLHLKRPSNEDCKALMATTEARDYLKPISNIYLAPVLFMENGHLVLLRKGYNSANGGAFVCNGDDVPEVPFEEAVKVIDELLCDFQHVSGSDRTRNLSLILSPALRFGGFLKGYCPVHSLEADQSQTGKGYALNIVSAIYGEECSLVTLKTGGVGSFDESLSQRLVDGRPFIQFDNLRGKLDSQHLEATLTTHCVGCRIPHHGEIDVDPQKYFYMATSNGFESTEDFANRSCIIRLRKQPAGYQFKTWPEGDLVAHIQLNQPYYLGCVHSIIRSWWSAGASRTTTSEHDFRDWARTVEGLIRFVWPDSASLLDGHRAAQERTANPKLVWLRSVCLAIEANNRLNEEISASSIVELCFENDIEIPSLKQDANLDTAKRQVGLILGRAIKNDSLILDEFCITRCEVDQRRNDGQGYFKMKMYCVNKTTETLSTTVTTVTTVGSPLCMENIMFSYSYREPAVAYCGNENTAEMYEI